MGALLNYLHHRQLSFDEKDESCPGVIARDFGGFRPKMQLLNEADALCGIHEAQPRGPVRLGMK